MSLSRHEDLGCQNVTFCPFCPCGDSQLNLHLLFWPFSIASKRNFFIGGLLRRLLCLPAVWGDWRFFSLRPFWSFVPGGWQESKLQGILNENKNQLGHGLVTIWGAAVWRSERKDGVLSWVEWLEKAHANSICSGVLWRKAKYGFKLKQKTRDLQLSLSLNLWGGLYFPHWLPSNFCPTYGLNFNGILKKSYKFELIINPCWTGTFQ